MYINLCITRECGLKAHWLVCRVLLETEGSMVCLDFLASREKQVLPEKLAHVDQLDQE